MHTVSIINRQVSWTWRLQSNSIFLSDNTWQAWCLQSCETSFQFNSTQLSSSPIQISWWTILFQSNLLSTSTSWNTSTYTHSMSNLSSPSNALLISASTTWIPIWPQHASWGCLINSQPTRSHRSNPHYKQLHQNSIQNETLLITQSSQFAILLTKTFGYQDDL